MRVLIIEDEAGIFAFVSDALRAEGMAVDGASDGVSGLHASLDGDYDLVVLDLMLPGRDGLSVLQALKAAKPHLPVLVLTARSDLETKLRGFALGATDYVTKPFSVDEFLARVRVQLRMAGTGTGATLNAGPLALDLIRREARSAQGTVQLSDREFALLRCLIERAGTVVQREELLADVWGIEFHPGTNVVDVCVRRLRKKLGAGAPIETIRNVGYRVAADDAAKWASAS